MKNLLWVVVGGALSLAVLVAVWGFAFDLAGDLGLDKHDFRLELFKILWQFLLLAVLGGALGLYFKTQEGATAARRETEDRERERREMIRKSLLSTRADLVRAYNQAKAIRRLLRASAFEVVSEQVVVRRDEYNSLMRRLIEAQLEFEYYFELVTSDRLLFPKPEGLKAQIKAVERYLNNVVGEFEDAWKFFAGNTRAPQENFKRLTEFVQPMEEKAPFETEFKKPFHKALQLVELTADEVS